MTHDDQEALGLFRFGIISGVDSGMNPGRSKEEIYRLLSENTYTLPNGKKIKYTAATIKKWYIKYTKGGLHALWPKQRIDIGKSRALTEDQIKRINEIKKKLPKITGQKVWETMVEEGTLKPSDASVDTIQRYLRMSNQVFEGPSKERLPFEFEHANDCWQADTVEFFSIMIDGVRKKVYEITWIDDHSRKVVGGEPFFNDNAENALIVLKKAIKTFGIPKRIILDNGSPYRSNELLSICAELNIRCIHCQPYEPQGKGKVERNHNTHMNRFVNCNTFEDCFSLDDVRNKFQNYLMTDYEHHVNRMTGETPDERFMKDYSSLRFIDAEKLDFIFLYRKKCTLYSDNTIHVFKKQFEVPFQYVVSLTNQVTAKGDAGKEGKKPGKRKSNIKIRIRYKPGNTDEVYIVDEENYKILYVLKEPDLAANTRRRRKSRVDYSVYEE